MTVLSVANNFSAQLEKLIPGLVPCLLSPVSCPLYPVFQSPVPSFQLPNPAMNASNFTVTAGVVDITNRRTFPSCYSCVFWRCH